MKYVDLIQPRHNYASSMDSGEAGHIYMPTSLLTAGARLIQAGVPVKFHDENIEQADVTSDLIGINLLGAPYIPEIIKLQKKYGQNKKYFLGGQVINGLSQYQFTKLFGKNSLNGNIDSNLEDFLSLESKLMSPENTSLISAYELLDDEVMKEYLSREFSLYVSQGCKFACDFCAAVRSNKNPITGEVTKIMEKYRDMDLIGRDLDYLVKRAKKLQVDELNIYMSNLDVFQTPNKLLEFSYTVQNIRRNNDEFVINLRGLATVDSFVRLKNKHSNVLTKLVKAGFYSVGYGVDGMTAEVWKAVKKSHNTKDKCIESIQSTREDYDIIPEILMVFGHESVDTEKSLKAAYEFTIDMNRKYDAVPRPHISKAFIPGNEGWKSEKYSASIDKMIENPELFQQLDFTALPTNITHPNNEQKSLTTEYFLKICNIPGNTTQYIEPIKENMTTKEILTIKKLNEGKFDR